MAATDDTRSPKRRVRRYRQVVDFPQVRGKTIERVELSSDVDDYVISIRFQDKTSLDFDIEAGITTTPEYSDWKTGDQREIRRWRPVRSKPARQ
jgi:hypothetical protein